MLGRQDARFGGGTKELFRCAQKSCELGIYTYITKIKSIRFRIQRPQGHQPAFQTPQVSPVGRERDLIFRFFVFFCKTRPPVVGRQFYLDLGGPRRHCEAQLLSDGFRPHEKKRGKHVANSHPASCFLWPRLETSWRPGCPVRDLQRAKSVYQPFVDFSRRRPVEGSQGVRCPSVGETYPIVFTRLPCGQGGAGDRGSAGAPLTLGLWLGLGIGQFHKCPAPPAGSC